MLVQQMLVDSRYARRSASCCFATLLPLQNVAETHQVAAQEEEQGDVIHRGALDAGLGGATAPQHLQIAALKTAITLN